MVRFSSIFKLCEYRVRALLIVCTLGVALLVKPNVAIAITNANIVDAVSPTSIYMRNGFELQNGSIRELIGHKTGDTFRYCNPVSVRSEPDINSKKVTSINDGNFNNYVIKKGLNYGWANVFKSGEFVGYSAQAIKDKGLITNIICPVSNWTTQSHIEIEGAKFEAELINQRELIITGPDGAVLYTRKVSGKTSLYELRDSNGLFGWIVGWDLYDDTPYYSDIDFTVARVVVPYVDSGGDQRVWDAVYNGVQNSKYMDIIQQGASKVTIVAGMAIWGPRFFMCTACTWHWGQPAFVTIERTSGGIKESIDNGELNFRSVPNLTIADRFLYNWLYWNPDRLIELLNGQVGDQINLITSRCSPNKLPFYKQVFIPQWKWTSWLQHVVDKRSGGSVSVRDQYKNVLGLEDYKHYSENAALSYGEMLDYIWDSSDFSTSLDSNLKWNRNKSMASGSEYFYDLRDCMGNSKSDKALIRNIVGYLNIPLDSDLLKAVIGEHH